jgi:hypothetical protein
MRQVNRNLIDHGGVRMRQQRIQKLVVASVALFMLSLGLSQSAWARGDRGGVGGRGFPGGVLQQLVFPCQSECRDAARECGESASGEAVTCIESACATQVQAAQTACAPDRTAQACSDAVTALRTCGESCLTTFQTAASACRDTEESCRDACESAQQ